MPTKRQREKRREERLHLRETTERPDFDTRNCSLRAETMDEKTRSIECTLATESPTQVMDRVRWEPILEVLRMDGCQIPERMPLLADHNRYSVDNVLGSIRQIRTKGDELIGRETYAEGDDASERTWNKVKQGHLTDRSIGYSVQESTEIPQGLTATVKGRTYTAPQNMRMRISTKWTPKEGSVVPIGADSRAKTRSDNNPQEIGMNPKLRKYLETLGLRADSTEAQAKEFYGSLPEATRAIADVEAAKPDPAAKPPEGQRSDPPANPPANPPTLTDTQRSEIATAERKRIADITRLGEGLPEATIRQAIDDGWTAERYAPAFLEAIRGTRAGAVPPGSQRSQDFNPAIHSRSKEDDCTAQALGMGLALRYVNGDTIYKMRAHYEPTHEGSSDYTLRRVIDAEAHGKSMARILEEGDRYRGMSLVDMCREACRLDGKQVNWRMGAVETFRTAVSGSALSNIFTTNINAMFLQGYTDFYDSTTGWVSESDVANFLTNERDMMGKFGALQKVNKGRPAEHLNISDWKESYKIARYGGQFVVDEIDIINDRFGAIEQMSPMDMGLTAAQLRPNLVYAVILANGNLDVDDGALFNTTAITTAGGHANKGSGTALSAAQIQTNIAAMGKQRINGRPLNIRPRFLIVPPDLRWTADITLLSNERIIAASSGGTYNPLKDLGIEMRYDDRFGVAGVTDPNTGTAYAGSATNWLLSARPGEEGAKTIEVGYRRGTGRAPQIRSFVLDKGQWGLGWDIKHDIGAKALDFRAMYFDPGA